jgi:hypothetical protein
VLVGDGAFGEDHLGSGANGSSRHLGVRTAAQPEGLVEQGREPVGQPGVEEQPSGGGVVEDRTGGVAPAGEQGRVDPRGVAGIEHRLDHAVDHVGAVLAPRIDHVRQPVRLDGHVVVEEDDEVTRAGTVNGAVASRGDPGPGLQLVGHGERTAGGGDDLAGRAVGVVVDHQHPSGAACWDVELLERPEEAGQGCRAPVGDDAHGHIEDRAGRSHAVAGATGRWSAERRHKSTATAIQRETASSTSAQ